MSAVIENSIIKTEAINSNFDGLGGLGNIYFNCLKKYSKNLALIDLKTNKIDTYGDILKRAVRTAIVLKDRGVKKGDIVIISSDNISDASVPVIACYFIGSIPCLLDINLTLLETTLLLNKVKPTIMFTIPEALENTLKAFAELEINPEIIIFGTSKRYTQFDTFLQEQNGENEFQPYFSTNLKETATICFSSGTTGLQKGCCLSHYYFIANCSLALAGRKIENIDEERRHFEQSIYTQVFPSTFLFYPSLYWISTGKIMFEIVLSGGCLLCDNFDAKGFWDIVDKYKVLGAYLSPYQIAELVRQGKPVNASASTLLKVITSGTTLPQMYNLALRKLLPFTDVMHTYALTETGVVTYFEMYDKKHREYALNHLDSVGFPYPGVSCKVVDLETNENVGPYQKGELRVKSNFLMNGYCNEDCQDLYDEEGWYKTADIVYYDENGCFYVIDRIKEIMKCRNHIVYPYVLEQELLKHPSVKQAVVIGRPNEIDGHHPMAFVVLDKNCINVTAQDIQEFVDKRVQDKCKLRGGVKIIENSLPLNTNGKVNRRELKRMFINIQI